MTGSLSLMLHCDAATPLVETEAQVPPNLELSSLQRTVIYDLTNLSLQLI